MKKVKTIIEKLRREQEEIAKRVKLADGFSRVKMIAGFDAGYRKEVAKGACVLVDVETFEVVEARVVKMNVHFPYIPTLLSYRELPVFYELYRRLKNEPDVLMVNGQGIAHPFFCGIASHFGVVVDKPSIGIAQSPLVGNYERPEKLMEATPIFFNERQVGWALKSKGGCREIFITPGNKVSLPSCLEITKMCIRGYKLPEPLRLADLYSKF